VAETKVTTPIAAGATPGTTTLTIRAQGPILPGSLSTAKSQCGKPNCACKTSPAKLHGTYHRWTGFIAGKRTTKTISKQPTLDPDFAADLEQIIKSRKPREISSWE
jgi:hypothetical protein